MCGISAIFPTKSGIDLLPIKKMTDQVRHRGPDDEGYVFFNGRTAGADTFGGADTPEDVFRTRLGYLPQEILSDNIAPDSWATLGHRRLSIIDLSPSGHQPMSIIDGRYWIVYNGEIYNWRELRREIERSGARFQSHSDTEVILWAYHLWGAGCLARFNGMFAFVLVDTVGRKVFAARDRFGVKPLYYWSSPRGFLALASEIKQFTILPGWSANLNNQRAYDFLAWGIADHTDETLFDGVRQLRGGQFIEIATDSIGRNISAKTWYGLNPPPVDLPFDAAQEKFRELFFNAVDLRLQADVPVGTGFSGGIDSSSIVCTVNAILQRERNNSAGQNTFSSCSSIKEFDEREFIDEVAGKIDVTAHYTYPRMEDLFPTINRITWHQDEPFNSTSIYAEWDIFGLVSRTPVKVTLDGHGSDELIAGYHIFFAPFFAGMIKKLRLLQLAREIAAVRRVHGYGIGFVAENALSVLLPDFIGQPIRSIIGVNTAYTDWIETRKLNIERKYPKEGKGTRQADVNAFSLCQFLYTSLPIQLHWSDRDSMAHSVESRAPFLDYRIVEFVMGCPERYKLDKGMTKRLLRSAMAGIVPAKILARVDKMGFVTPEEVWVRRQNPNLFRSALTRSVENARGVMNDRALVLGNRIIDGKDRYNNLLWRMISFGTWMDCFSVRA